jgi:hypothetical protein
LPHVHVTCTGAYLGWMSAFTVAVF